VIDFGQRLPRLRRALARDLGLAGLPRGKVLAIVVSLLAETLIRVGNVRYRDENKSFGLTTLLARHVAFLRGRAQFRFRGKGGLRHAVAIDDSRLVRLLRRCQQLPGQTLFQYIDDENESRPIDSGMVNDYLFAAMGVPRTSAPGVPPSRRLRCWPKCRFRTRPTREPSPRA
jgi:DNA topoisomerase IB